LFASSASAQLKQQNQSGNFSFFFGQVCAELLTKSCGVLRRAAAPKGLLPAPGRMASFICLGCSFFVIAFHWLGECKNECTYLFCGQT